MTKTFERVSGIFMLFFIAITAIFYPKAGSLVARLSAVVGFFIIYLIPCLLHMKDVLTDGRH